MATYLAPNHVEEVTISLIINFSKAFIPPSIRSSIHPFTQIILALMTIMWISITSPTQPAPQLSYSMWLKYSFYILLFTASNQSKHYCAFSLSLTPLFPHLKEWDWAVAG